MGGHVNSALSVSNWLPSAGKRTTLVLMAEVGSCVLVCATDISLTIVGVATLTAVY